MNKLHIISNFSNILISNLNIFKTGLFTSKLTFNRFPSFNQELNIIRCLNYKKGKPNHNQVFTPSTIAVSNANKHLTILLYDQNDQNLGKMSLENANTLAKDKELKLVNLNDNSPPEFKLMTGTELFKLQMSLKDKKKTVKELKQKEIEMNLGIEEHDLEIKLKMIKSFYDKGHPIKIEVKSRIMNKKTKNIRVLQREFVDKIKTMLNFAKVEIESSNENLIILIIEANSNPTDEIKKN